MIPKKNKDNDYYYGKFNQCPLCSSNAKVVLKPVSKGSVGGIMLYTLLDGALIKVVISEEMYISNNNMISDLDGNSYELYSQGTRYYFLELNGKKIIIRERDDRFEFTTDREYKIPKKHKSFLDK